jgi:hypothetical protein
MWRAWILRRRPRGLIFGSWSRKELAETHREQRQERDSRIELYFYQTGYMEPWVVGPELGGSVVWV